MAVTARNTFTIDNAGQEAVIRGLGAGFNDFVRLVQERVKALTLDVLGPYDTGYHTRGHGKPPRIGHYRDTIQSATWVQGKRIDGPEVQATGFDPLGGSDLHGIVFTDSSLGHMLELTGAAPHDIPIGSALGSPAGPFHSTMIVKHPGFTRRPHFTPGLLSTASEVGAQMKGKVRK